MLRKGKSAARSEVPPSEMTEADVHVVRFVDGLLDKERPFFRKGLLEGLKWPEELRAAAKRSGNPFRAGDAIWLKQVRLALQRRDRKKLLALFREVNLRDPLPPGEEHKLPLAVQPQIWRKAFLYAADQFKGEPGKPSQIEIEQYPVMAAKADSLFPVILKLIEERGRGSKRPIEDYLDFWKPDYPKACAFLAKHIDSLKELLKADTLPKPAKRPKTRARIVAECLAGVEYGFSYGTSIEYVRQGRRLRGKNSPSAVSSN